MVLKLWVANPAGMGFDFIMITPPYHLAEISPLSFSHKVSFLGYQHPPVNGCSRAGFDFGVLKGEDDCKSFYSAILNLTLFLFSNLSWTQ